MSTRVSSRLAKSQQKQLLRQTIIYVVAAIALGLAFIFFILPRSINLFFTLTGGNQAALENTSDVPPQVPAFSAPPPATASASITLSGFGEAKSEVVLVVNGQQQTTQRVNDEGAFTIDAQLSEGENQIAAFARGQNGQESSVSRTYSIVRDNQAPTLELEQPQDGQVIELARNQTMTIKGKTEPGSQLQVNGRSLYVNSDGTFSGSYQLQEGENKLEFTARDQAGNQTQKTISVTFRF